MMNYGMRLECPYLNLKICQHNVQLLRNKSLCMKKNQLLLNNNFQITKIIILELVIYNKEYFYLAKLLNLICFEYDDRFNKSGLPINFVYQNTYSYNFLTKIFKKNGAKKVEFIDDKSQYNNINKEFQKYNNKQDAVTKALKNGQQIAGSKVFEWKWIKITL